MALLNKPSKRYADDENGSLVIRLWNRCSVYSLIYQDKTEETSCGAQKGQLEDFFYLAKAAELMEVAC